MRKIFKLIILISLFTLSCGEENIVTPPPIDEGITWEQITGKLAYLKGNVLYLIDADTRSVNNFGVTNLTNLKWDKTSGNITGIRFVDDSTYSLEGIDLDGNHTILNNTLSTKYYDWIPDGRLCTLSDKGKIQINGTTLLNQTFYTAFGMACSPDGKKIVVSTDNIIENLLVEIDINSLSQRIIERNSNIVELDFLQPVYSLESDKVIYVTYESEFRLLDPPLRKYRVWSMPKIQLGAGKDPCRSDNLQRILYTKVHPSRVSIIGIYSMDITDGNSVELIKGGHTPIWIY
jgi:hypothetical protein